MLTIFSFLISLIGGVNWLMIGLLQYDFIAGIFGYQASIFSRIIYIVFGLGSVVLLFKMFKGKGTIAVFSRKNKKDLKKNIDKINEENMQTAGANVEASKEQFSENKPYTNEVNSQYSQPRFNQNPNGDYPPNEQWNGHYQGSNPIADHGYDYRDNYPPRDDYYQRQDSNHQGTTSEDGLFDEHLGRR